MKTHLLILFLALFALQRGNGQSLENKNWSIDYNVWNDNGTPALNINCGTDPVFDFQEDFTIEMWVRAWNFVENRKIIGKANADDGTFDNGYVMGFIEGQVYAEYFNPSLQQVPITGSGTMPVDSAYVHMASVYSVSEGKLFNYINGELSGETDMFPSAGVAIELSAFIIGNAPWDEVSFQFYGDLDEVRVWDKALTEDEIKASMHFKLMGDEEDLVAYYPFDDASGATVPDNGPNGVDGTLINSDHISVGFGLSGAPVADVAMNGLQDVKAAYYNTEENFHKISSDNGMSVITDIVEKEYWKYLVMGNTNATGITPDNAPSTAPIDFNRTAREWYVKCAPGVSGTFTLDLAESGGGLIQDSFNLDQYALLWRANLEDDFIALAHPTSPISGIYQFQEFGFEDGYYAFAVSGATFEIQTGIEELKTARSFGFYPNPTSGKVAISGIISGDKINVYNELGRLIRTITSTSNTNLKIELSDQPKGLYVVHIQSKNTSFTHRIILQ